MRGSAVTEETFSCYDTADYLKTNANISAYLEAMIDEVGDDHVLLAHALRVVARARAVGTSRN
jgi:DNA-binding phage protein